MKLDSSSECDLSYEEDNVDLDRNECTALLPLPGISSYEHGSGNANSTRVGTSSQSRKGLRHIGTPPGEREYNRTEKKIIINSGDITCHQISGEKIRQIGGVI